MKNYTLYAIRYTLSLFLIINLIGCEAFVRKFTRKPKEDTTHQEPMVLTPEEYKPTLSKEEQYRQYFMFWKAWQEELIASLLVVTERINSKKQVDSANEALKNLMSMKQLLNADAQKKLDPYLSRMVDLKDSVEKDIYGNNIFQNRLEAERLKRDILQNFSFPNIKKVLL